MPLPVRVRVNVERVTARFLVRLLHEARYFGEQILANRRGAILSELNSETIGDLLIVVPPLHEQFDIEERLSKEISSISEVAERIGAQIDRLREYRSALITAAVTGCLHVQKHEKKMEILV